MILLKYVILASNFIISSAIVQENSHKQTIAFSSLFSTTMSDVPLPPATNDAMPSDGKASNTATKRKKKIPSKNKRKSRAVFVVKLFQFLASGQHSDIVSWHKDAFVVWNRLLFAEQVLPLLFSHNRFPSFERQANFYNFAKMAIEEDVPTKKRIGKQDPIKYKHRLFHQGASVEQVLSIERSTSPYQVRERSILMKQLKNYRCEADTLALQTARLHHIYQALQEEIKDRRAARQAQETEAEQERMAHSVEAVSVDWAEEVFMEFDGTEEEYANSDYFMQDFEDENFLN